ncbi:MAG: hypothetical protein AAF485_23480 [Chloroflexota bacterium]
MNEQERANALAEQLDRWLIDDAVIETNSDEFADLLQVAEQIVDATPKPQPDFGPRLKQSLQSSDTTNGGTPSSRNTLLIGAVITLVVGALFAGLVIVGLFVGGLLQDEVAPTPTNPPAPVEPSIDPTSIQATPTPAPTSTATPQTIDVKQTTDTLVLPSPTSTAIIDILPLVTTTTEPTDEIIVPLDLVPGQPSNGSDDGGSNSGNGNSGTSGNSGSDDDDDD